MKLQKLLSYVRRAVDDYSMIEEGDKIAVGISGGKESICLLAVSYTHLASHAPHTHALHLTFPPDEVSDFCPHHP